MTSPTDPNFNQKPIYSENSDQNADLNSSWYFRNVRPMIGTAGHAFSDLGAPVMTAGFVHGLARNISVDYLISMRRYPSGAVVFLTGLAIKAIGNSLVNNYTTGSLSNSITVVTSSKVDSIDKKE